MTDTTTVTSTGSVLGLEVELESTFPDYATDTFEVDSEVVTTGTTEDINIAVVIDTSGSTSGNSGSDVDDDGDNDDFLEAQVYAAKELFQSYIDAGYSADDITITLIEYNTNASTVGTYTLSDQDDFDDALDDLDSGGFTNYENALEQVYDEWKDTTTDNDDDNDVEATDTNVVYFLSDGYPFLRNNQSQDFEDEVDDLTSVFNAQIVAIGVGSNSSLDDLNDVDTTGGAIQVTDVSELSDIISSPLETANFEYFEIIVDGVVVDTVDVDDPAVTQTTFGYFLEDYEVSGYTYVIGGSIEVEVRAVFDDGGSVLTTGTITIPTVVCFASDTLIMTSRGEVLIEELQAGDLVRTRDNGMQPIRWIGNRHFDASELAANPALYPVKIEANSFGQNMPSQELTVSPQHRVFIDDWRTDVLLGAENGIFMAAVTLVNGSSIQRIEDVETVTYFHIAFDNHEVIWSNNLPTESLLLNDQTLLAVTKEQQVELSEIFSNVEDIRSGNDEMGLAYRQGKKYEAKVLMSRVA